MSSGPRYRVLVVPDWYPSRDHPFAGAFVREQVRALVRAGHEVTVLATGRETPRGGALGTTAVSLEDGALVVRVRPREPRPRRLVTVARGLALRAGLDRIVALGRRPQIVHAHVYAAGLLAIPIARALDAPLVVTEHYSGFALGKLNAWDRVLARRVFATADLVAPVCEDLLGHIRRTGAAGQFQVVPNLVDTELFRPPEGPPHAPGPTPTRLLLVAGLSDVKGVPHALRAVVRLPHQTTLDVVGDGPNRRAYESLAEELGITDRVRWHGVQPAGRIAELMRAADLYVLASEWEGLPTVLIEALASGLPVVATQVGGVPEMIRQGDGLLVPPRDPQALANAITRAIGTDWDRQAIARRAASRYGAESVVPRWEAIYATLLERQRRRGYAERSR